MIERNVDMAAVGRIAKRVNLLDIRLTSMSAKREPGATGTLEAQVDYDCKPLPMADGRLEVTCSYDFKVKCSGNQCADAQFTYLITYALLGDAPITDEDLGQFATANGAYHSWPFVRESLYGVTSKMGFPSYVLPVLIFKPLVAKKEATEPKPEPAEQ